ncbi:MAG: undecaprenyldiphospho-muramoylpentapeptide beta-N-acetylglucosaminyltransferase [Candidatus Tagabacteria bacterium CG03_land_8_20_14_0_80_41_22]|uniref:UDP-N-acetylglucosamine--N-acetylmuramyl-(pentapeptide) pyrophosphoryl-undecaprenol N-acetylglucosamine transferase n=1 Tax=Candidatus Tagabacteria bacterium CG03_land_8_20_14_0_80_41_22 TaxID=1975020 RepID=A0A2M7B9V5_9BACT|nr:MAG: undecaprenyldiphospho-muramoylpentapeptide beta-N-acetylglucosaminyltransferase [Candidatus Tagabacteria bacterium CG03_land_8_20_14_0_80_41_22]
MKILFTGGGTGGHFAPIISIIEALRVLIEEERLVGIEFIFMSDSPYDNDLLIKQDVRFIKVGTGKMRRYFSLLNVTDIFKTIGGLWRAFWIMYHDFPDVVFGKGGYASFPAMFAARILGIPVIIHESDVVPGRVNQWAAKFAKRIAISFPESVKYFPAAKTALTGNPIRRGVLGSTQEEAKEIFQLEKDIPVIFIYGGSQGSKNINDNIIDIAPEIVKFANVIHQCGKNNIEEVNGRLSVALEKSSFKFRYHVLNYLDENMLRNVSSVASVIVSRAGASSIFEIAAWGIPSIIIPITNSAQDHQRENAYSYARTGAAEVIEESNLTPNILLSEIKRLLEDKKRRESMKEAAKNFAQPKAARKIARELLSLALEHSS